MNKWIGLASALALGLALGAAQAEAKVKACWIYVGAIGDHGYSYQHDQGRIYVEKELGDKLETVHLENVAEGPDAERAIARLARSGCNIIFTTSFGYMEPTLKVAKQFPDVKFEHATGYKTAPTTSPPTTPSSTRAATSSARSPPRCRRPARPATSSPSPSPRW